MQVLIGTSGSDDPEARSSPNREHSIFAYWTSSRGLELESDGAVTLN